MTTIGAFSKIEDGYQGTLTTLSLKTKLAIKPVETKGGEKSPDFRVFAGQVEIGAAWAATSKGGNLYLNVKLDDPSFPNPIIARLVQVEQGHALVWNR